MSYKLFLEDVKHPNQMGGYMKKKINGKNDFQTETDWVIVTSFDEFVKTIWRRGLPDIISFDHEVAEEHYIYFAILSSGGKKRATDSEYKSIYQKLQNKTGYDCARWLVKFCANSRQDLPVCLVHSKNIAGNEYLEDVLPTKSYSNKPVQQIDINFCPVCIIAN